MKTHVFAIVGDGYMTRRYRTTIEQHPRAELGAVLTRKAVTEEGALDALAGDDRIEGVIVCSPDHTHPDYVARLLAQGKMVLCEKPLARTEGEFARINAAGPRPGQLAVGMNCRFRSRIMHLKALADGPLSGVKMITAAYYSSIVPILEGTSRTWWREFPTGIVPFLHGGAIHLFDALRFIAGGVEAALCAHVPRPLSGPLGGDSFVVMLRFTDGSMATVTITGTSRAPNRFQIGIEAERGSVDEAASYVIGPDGTTLTEPMPVEDYKDLERQLAHIVDVLDGRAQPINSLDEAQSNFLLIRACEQSLASGAWVPVGT